jgi:hypothetical protein
MLFFIDGEHCSDQEISSPTAAAEAQKDREKERQHQKKNPMFLIFSF